MISSTLAVPINIYPHSCKTFTRSFAKSSFISTWKSIPLNISSSSILTNFFGTSEPKTRVNSFLDVVLNLKVDMVTPEGLKEIEKFAWDKKNRNYGMILDQMAICSACLTNPYSFTLQIERGD